jgi:hypothetical protein
MELGRSLFLPLLLGTGIGIFLGVGLVALGWGLYRGERVAVVGTGVCVAFGLGCALLLASEPSGMDSGLFVALATLAVYAPPLLAGIVRWRELP